jgi:hypothetical protein
MRDFQIFWQVFLKNNLLKINRLHLFFDVFNYLMRREGWVFGCVFDNP